MTGVLVDALVARHPRVLACPRAVPRCRVLDGKPIEHRLRIQSREALDDVQLVAGAAELGLVGKVGCVDDQRIPFPVSDRIAHPLANRPRRMVRVHPDDADVVHHLVQHHDGVARLDDLFEVVVEIVGQCGRS